MNRAAAMLVVVFSALLVPLTDASSEASRPRHDDRDQRTEAAEELTLASEPTQSPEATPSQLTASYELLKEWEGGFKAEITVRNTGTEPVSPWQLAFDYPTEIENIWRARIDSRSGDTYLVSGLDYSETIEPGESVVFGFQGEGSPDAEPVFLIDDAVSAPQAEQVAEDSVPTDLPEQPTQPTQDDEEAVPPEPVQQQQQFQPQAVASAQAPDIVSSGGTHLGQIVDVPAGTSAADLQSMIDEAPAGATLRLAAGEFVLDRTLTIARDDLTLEGAGSGRTILVYDPAPGEEGEAIALHSAGLSESYKLSQDARAGDRTIVLAGGHGFEPGMFVWLERPNTDEFFEEIGDESWLKDQPLRTSIARVTAVNGNELTLENGIYFDYDSADTTVRNLDMVENVTLQGFSIETALGETDPADFSNNYDEYDFIAMVDLEGTYRARLQDIAIHDSGSKAFLFKKTLAMTATDLLADGTHNKGKGGNGYAFELKEVYESNLSGLEDHGMRHSVIFGSWYSAANNTIQVDFTDRDINFHGGRHHNNVVRVEISERDPGADNLSSVVSYNAEGERWGAPTDPNANSVVFHRVLGSKRPDDVTGDDDGAWLDGRGADDNLRGGAGADTLIGGKGDDALDGGDGVDHAVFAGDLADFDIEVRSDGSIEVDGPDGRDSLRNIEWLTFDDQTVPVTEFGIGAGVSPVQPG